MNINQIKKHLDDTERLIEMQSNYINKLRWLLLRSILKSQGNERWNEPLNEGYLTDSFDFKIGDGIEIINGKDIGMVTENEAIVKLKQEIK